MKNKKTENEFKYTYSANEQEEIRAIRQKYQPKEDDDMTKLRKLDAGVTHKALKMSLKIGIIGVLVLGMGMSFIMTNLGEILSLNQNMSVIAGILFGLIGVILIALAYPVHNWVLKKEREKVAPEIMQLTEKLLK